MGKTTRQWIIEARYYDDDSVESFIAAEGTPLHEVEEWVDELFQLLDGSNDYEVVAEFTGWRDSKVVEAMWHHPALSITARLGTLFKVDTP